MNKKVDRREKTIKNDDKENVFELLSIVTANKNHQHVSVLEHEQEKARTRTQKQNVEDKTHLTENIEKTIKILSKY